MPIKIEEEQFESKITEMPADELQRYYQELYKLLNIKTLEKLSKKELIEI